MLLVTKKTLSPCAAHLVVLWLQVKPAASYAGSSVTTLDFLADTFSNRNQGNTATPCAMR